MFSAMSRYGTYWWPRRKVCREGVSTSVAGVRILQCYYSFQGLEQGIPDSPQDMPFIDGFPARLIREGLPGRLNRESIARRSPAASELQSRKIFASPWAEQLLSQNTEIVIPHNLVGFTENAKKVQKAVKGEEQVPIQSSSLAPSIADSKLSAPLRVSEVESSLVFVPTSESQSIQEGAKIERVDTIETPETGSEDSTTILEKDKLVLPDQETLVHTEVNTELRKATRSDRIHVLGTGWVSKYIAHSIASLPHAPPVAMLVNRSSMIEDWQQEGAGIRLIRGEKIHTQLGIELESVRHFPRRARRTKSDYIPGTFMSIPQERIDNLVVAADAHFVIPALLSIRHRLHPATTICFVDGGDVSGLGVSGLGVLDVVNSEVFPDPVTRPCYSLANLSHKIAPTLNTYTIIEEDAGEACFTVLYRDAKMPEEATLLEPGSDPLVRRIGGEGWGPFTHIMKTLTRTPEFNSSTLGHSNFLKITLEKMIVRSVIGPLTVMFDCSNEQLLHNYNIQKAMAPLLEECSQVVCALPEIAPRDIQYFSPEHLQTIIVSVLQTTGSNISPMLQAIRKGQRTGIEFCNGYFVRRGKELGVPCHHNQMMIDLVNSKASLIGREREGYIPFKSSGRGS
jgi:2-dehydropantoate 2-reductase